MNKIVFTALLFSVLIGWVHSASKTNCILSRISVSGTISVDQADVLEALRVAPENRTPKQNQAIADYTEELKNKVDFFKYHQHLHCFFFNFYFQTAQIPGMEIISLTIGNISKQKRDGR
jgi:hypothetical protein